MNARIAAFSLALLTPLALLGASCSTQSTDPASSQAEATGTSSMNHDTSEHMPYTVDVAASKVKWNASKVTGKHFGHVTIKSGTIEMYEGTPMAATFVMDMTTITVEDMQESNPMHAALFKHLRSDDFFSVETHPTATFTATGFTKLDGDNYKVDGDLEIKGITQPISFTASITVDGTQAKALGTIAVDRTNYDIKFRSGKFFSDLGDSLIHDEFTIDIDVVANAS